jgi:hypothetical protein
MNDAGPLDQAIAHLSNAVDRLEAGALEVFEAMARRADPASAAAEDPAILRDPRVRAAGITLADVNLDGAGAPFRPELGEAEDPQDRLDRLAEEWAADHGGDLADEYRAVAREDPDLWLAAREAAYLNGTPRRD